MRTTINLDDDVLRAAKNYAESRSLALGKAVSELLRRGIVSRCPTRVVNGLRVFDLPLDSRRVTTKHVRQIEDDEP